MGVIVEGREVAGLEHPPLTLKKWKGYPKQLERQIGARCVSVLSYCFCNYEYGRRESRGERKG